jgi:hypothetical protein
MLDKYVEKGAFLRVRHLTFSRGASPTSFVPLRPTISERVSNCASNHIGHNSLKLVGQIIWSIERGGISQNR